MKRGGILLIILCLIVGYVPLCAGAEEAKLPAKAAILMDAATGTVLYEQDSHTPHLIASVTKIMTMLLVMEAIDSGRIALSDTVTASDTAAGKGGSQLYLKAGETMTVEQLLKSVAVSSANDAACALAEHIAGSEAAFVKLMNSRAQELGMENTHFINCSGLDDDENADQHKSSAYDIALMSRQLLTKHPDIKNYTTIWMDTVRDGAFGLSNTNKLIRFYPGATGLKTGYTSKAGFCLSASAQREGMELIAVVLGCETSQERFNACKGLLDHGFANYALIDPPVADIPQVTVRLGTAAAVAAVPSENSALLIDKAQKNTVTTQVLLEETELSAPISKGQRLGTMTVRSGQQVLAQIPLVAEEAVPRLSFGEIFVKLLRRVCMTRG